METDAARFIEENMISIPGGHEEVRRFHDRNKWLSSDYRMSIPSSGKAQSSSTETLYIAAFQLSKVPVTNQLYNWVSGAPQSKDGKLQEPKVYISWIDSIRFCNRISRFFGFSEYYSIDEDLSNIECIPQSRGFRLPTVGEWQYACKGGLSSYQYGDIDDIAWHKENSGGRIHRVAAKKPNPWGLYDTLGNCWEWCWDLYNQETYREYRIFRGGSFAEKKRICGSTARRKSHPDFAIDDLGFRLARSL